MDDYLKGHKASGIKVGDKVRVLRKAESNENGWNNTWAGEMSEYVGREIEVVRDGGASGFDLDVPAQYGFPYFVLQKIEGTEMKKGDVVIAWDDDQEKRVVGYFMGTRNGMYCVTQRQDTVNKSTDYNGFDYKNAELYRPEPALPHGLKIGDKVWVSDAGEEHARTNKHKRYLRGYVDGGFVCSASEGASLLVWDYAIPAAPQRKVLPAGKLAQALLDKGYAPDNNGSWAHTSECCTSITNDVFAYCGQEPPKWLPDWMSEEG